ncbi:MAG: polymer-forming cytoskeletal protein [Chloroflexi bacterium]|nr:polymer-forming cytoskeletal protein [Chloroflexota bacterium]
MLLAAPALAEGSEPITVVGQDYIVDDGNVVNSDLVVVGGNLTLQPESQVNGQIAVTGGDVTAAGTINGNLVVIGGHVQLSSSATVNGDIISSGSVEKADDAVINGRIISGLDAAADSRFTNRLLSLGHITDRHLPGAARVLGTIALVVLYVLLNILVYYVATRNVLKITQIVRRSWLPSLGAGLLTALVCVVLVPILVVICIGIPVAVVLVIALFVTLMVGSTALTKLIGHQVLAWFKASASPVLEVVCGAGIMALIALVPCVGAIVAAIAGAVGIGATMLSHFGTRDYPLSVE